MRTLRMNGSKSDPRHMVILFHQFLMFLFYNIVNTHFFLCQRRPTPSTPNKFEPDQGLAFFLGVGFLFWRLVLAFSLDLFFFCSWDWGCAWKCRLPRKTVLREGGPVRVKVRAFSNHSNEERYIAESAPGFPSSSCR